MHHCKTTLGNLLKSLEILDDFDVDMGVDGSEEDTWIGVVFPIKLTKKGKLHFKPIMGLEVENWCIMGNDEDYDQLDEFEVEGKGNGGRLQLAKEFLRGQAGYCSCKDFDEWFRL